MIVFNKAPNLFADHITLMALEKQIGTIDEYFDGTNGAGNASLGTLLQIGDWSAYGLVSIGLVEKLSRAPPHYRVRYLFSRATSLLQNWTERRTSTGLSLRRRLK